MVANYEISNNKTDNLPPQMTIFNFKHTLFYQIQSSNVSDVKQDVSQ